MTDRPEHVSADGTIAPFDDAQFAQWQADTAAAAAMAASPPPPDGPTLSDWRTALVLWNRLDQVDAAIAALKADPDQAKVTLGKVAEQRFQFANNVFRAQLMAFKDSLGFTEADVDESLWRAGQVAKGDLSGIWPLAA